jgi:tungstate transport system ATP-binding protein
LVLLGPNGAGKSTLLQVAAGLKKPSSGSTHFVQNPHLSDLDYRRKVSTVFQSPLLLTDTVENNIASGMKFRRIPGPEVRRRVQLWMGLLHITHLAKRQANVLSGGEAQRVSLARAFCLETELILMDEPFSALDTPTRQGMLDDLRDIFSKTNQTCIYVTHDLEEALSIGDRVAVFFDGCLHQLGDTEKVFTHPATPKVAAFMGVETIIPGKVTSRSEGLVQIQANGSIIEAASNVEIGSNVYICLRPEDITLNKVDQQINPSTARNRIPCRITRLSNQGPFIRVHMDAGFSLVALVTRPSAREMQLEVGKEVLSIFKASAIHIIPSAR